MSEPKPTVARAARRAGRPVRRARWGMAALAFASVLVLGPPPVGATVTVQPPVADPGDAVTVSGTFSLACAGIDVELDGKVVASLAPAGGVAPGPYAASFVVPGSARDGDHVVLVVCHVPGAPDDVQDAGGLTTPRTPVPATTPTTAAPSATATTALPVIPTSPSTASGAPGSETTAPAVPPTVTDSTDVGSPPSPTSTPTPPPPSATAPSASTTTASGPSTPTIATVTTAPAATVPATTGLPAVGLVLDQPAVAPGGDVTATGTGCQPGTPVDVTTGDETVGTATADGAGGFRSALETDDLALGRHRLTASCGTVLQTDLDVVLAADVGGAGPSVAVVWLAVLALVALAQAPIGKRRRRTSVR